MKRNRPNCAYHQITVPTKAEIEIHQESQIGYNVIPYNAPLTLTVQHQELSKVFEKYNIMKIVAKITPFKMPQDITRSIVKATTIVIFTAWDRGKTSVNLNAEQIRTYSSYKKTTIAASEKDANLTPIHYTSLLTKGKAISTKETPERGRLILGLDSNLLVESPNALPYQFIIEFTYDVEYSELRYDDSWVKTIQPQTLQLIKPIIEPPKIELWPLYLDGWGWTPFDPPFTFPGIPTDPPAERWTYLLAPTIALPGNSTLTIFTKRDGAPFYEMYTYTNGTTVQRTINLPPFMTTVGYYYKRGTDRQFPVLFAGEKPLFSQPDLEFEGEEFGLLWIIRDNVTNNQKIFRTYTVYDDE